MACCETQLYKTNGKMNMGQNSGTSKRSEKGLLTPGHSSNSTVALGKAARVFDVPAVLTTVETKSFGENATSKAREPR
jgi:hypothetical protein